MIRRFTQTALWAAAVSLSIVIASLSFAQNANAATPVCVQGVSGVAPTATLKFTAPTANTDATPVSGPLTYALFAGTSSGGETQVATALSGSPISVTTGLAPNSTVYFYVVAVDAHGVSSAPSNEGCKIFPASVPGAVTITIS